MVWTAQNIQLTIKNKAILNIKSLTLPENQVTAIIGPNGAGKSSLLNVLSGRYPHIPVQCNGISAKSLTEKGKIAKVSQHEHFDLPLTLKSYVLLGCTPSLSWFAKPNMQAEQQAQTLLEQFELLPLQHKRVSTLSGGEQQRAAIVRALLQNTDYLLLDEPSNHLDIRHQHYILNLLSQLKYTRPITIVMVLHDLNLAGHYSDHVVLLHQGQLVNSGSPEEVMLEERLSQIYQWNIRRQYHEGNLIFTAHIC